MEDISLKYYIHKCMPDIDDILADSEVPIYDRAISASYLFVKIFVVDTFYGTKEDFLASKEFRECVIPVINDWYYETYDLLAKSPKKFVLQGLITIRSQPSLIEFSTIISTIEEEGKSSWMKFIDHLDPSESIQEMIKGRSIILAQLDEPYKTDTIKQIEVVIGRLRTISLNLSGLSIDDKTDKMARSIIGHFEKAAIDIVSYDIERVATACWEVHLAIEKSLKVFLKQKTGSFKTIHSLNELFKTCLKIGEATFRDVSLDMIQSLPNNAISLRYAECTIPVKEAVQFYNNGLLVVQAVSDELDREYNLKNSSLLINKAPWAR